MLNIFAVIKFTLKCRERKINLKSVFRLYAKSQKEGMKQSQRLLKEGGRLGAALAQAWRTAGVAVRVPGDRAPGEGAPARPRGGPVLRVKGPQALTVAEADRGAGGGR